MFSSLGTRKMAVLIVKESFFHLHGQAVTVHQPLDQSFYFGQFVAEEIPEGVEFSLVEVLLSCRELLLKSFLLRR